MVSEENAKQDVNSQPQENAPSPGTMLKARRETLGLSQQDVADKLFLKARQINDLECDVIEEKSSVTFTKGYVRNYAKQLNMNAQEVIEAFERFHNQTSVPSSEKLQSFSKRVAKQTHDDRWMMVTYIILLLIIAGVVAWWYQQPTDEAVSDVSLADTVKQEAANTPMSPESIQDAQSEISASELDLPDETVDNVDAIVMSEAAGLDDQAEPREPSSLDASGFTQEGDLDDGAISAPDSDINNSNNLTELVAEDDAPQLPDFNPQSNAAAISMIFTFDDDCWVNIKDATGEAIAYGVKQKGRVMEIQGVPPVEVTLGAPDNVRISVNDEPVDISSYQNGRTARFTLPM